MPGERRTLTSDGFRKKGRKRGLTMSLQTPGKIRELQTKLYVKAKQEQAGVLSLPEGTPRRFCVMPGVKSVGKPDAGNRHVRFDERGGETGRLPVGLGTALLLDSTNPGQGSLYARYRRRLLRRTPSDKPYCQQFLRQPSFSPDGNLLLMVRKGHRGARGAICILDLSPPHRSRRCNRSASEGAVHPGLPTEN